MSTPESSLERVTDEPTMSEALDAAFAPAVEAPSVAPVVEPPPAAESVPAVAAEAPVVPEPPTTPTTPEPPLPESRLAPLFQLATLPLDEAAPQMVQHIQELAAYDPNAMTLLTNALYMAKGNTFRQWALDDFGLTQDDITKFADWRQKGGGELVAPMYYPPFPEPGADGIVLLPGIGQVDTSDEWGKRFYDNEKYRYDKEAEGARAAYEKQATDARTVEEKTRQGEAAQAQLIETRRNDFAAGIIGDIATSIEAAMPQLAKEDEWKREVIGAYAISEVQKMQRDQNSPFSQKLRESIQYVDVQAGRMTEYRSALADIGRKAALAAVDRFNREILKTNQAQLALHATAAQLPPGTVKVESQVLAEQPKPTTTQQWMDQAIKKIPENAFEGL